MSRNTSGYLTVPVLLLLLFFVSIFAYAQRSGDAPGTQDHPLVTRYTGSNLVAYDSKEYDAFTLILGPATREAGKIVPAKKQPLEGKVTRLLYVGPEGRSSLEVFRNYQAAFKQAGFETLYSCSAAECGQNFLMVVYPGNRYLKIAPGYSRGTLSTNIRDLYYLAGKKSTEAGDVYISLFIALHNAANTPNALLEIVETKAMDTGMVTVSADQMAEGIETTGHIALYGIHFDFNSAEIKPESDPALQEISKMLKQKQSLKLLVVGHTDNQGGYDYNMGLSQRRADAVVKKLISTHGIEASRLKPAGVGYLAPVASNDTEDGKAKNRRVELVKQ